MASIVLDLVVPGAGSVVSVLAEILQLCGEMKESQEVFARVHRRLTDIFTELEKLAAAKQTPANAALDRYVDMVQKFLDCLSRYRGKPIYIRLLQYQKMMDEIRLVNEEIDTLFKVLNIATTGVIMEWKQQWERDCAEQMELLVLIAGNSESVLSELRSLRDQVEALTVLGYEVQQKRLGAETLKPVKHLYNEIVRVSKASVETIPAWFIPEHDLQYDPKPFASGSFGAVHRGTWGAGTKVVVKTMLQGELPDAAAAMAQFLREVQVWYDLRHPNVVRMFGACHVTSPPFIVCEDASNGNLATFLATYGQDCMWGLLHEAALGLDHLHRNRVVHGDLKLNNLLVGSNGAALVADFGLSFVNDGSVHSKPQDRGGLRWLAPECLTGAPTFESDVFSFAMCILEAVQGEAPFAYTGDDTVIHNLREAKIPPRPAQMPDEAWDLVVSMTAFDPSKRPAMSVVISTLGNLKTKMDKSTSSASLLRKPTNVQRFRQDSDVHELVAALQSGSESTRHSALKWLYRNADDEAMAHAIKQSDGYRRLVHCFQQAGASWDETIYVYGCLQRMLNSGAITQDELKIIAFPVNPSDNKWDELLETVRSPSRDVEAVLEALEKLRWIREWDVAKKYVLIPSLINLLRVGTLKQLEEATRTLQVLVDVKKDAEVVVENGALPLLINQFDVGPDCQKEQSAVALGYLAKFFEAAAPPRVIQYLTELVRTGLVRQKIAAARALKDIVVNPANSHTVAEAHVFEPLVDLLRGGSDRQKSTAAETLRLCLTTEVNKRAITDAGAIPLLVELARSGSRDGKQTASMALGRLADHSESRVQAISDAGGIRVTVDLIRGGCDVTKLCALFTLINLARTQKHQLAIAAAGALVPVVELVRSGTGDQKVYAADVLANLALNNEPMGRAIGAAGGIPPLVALVREGNDMQTQSAARAMERLATNEDNARALVDAGAIAALAKLAETGRDQHKALAAVVLNRLSHVEPEATRIRIEFAPIIEHLRSLSEDERAYAAFALDKLAAISQANCEAIVAAGGITSLVELVHAGSDFTKSNATSILQQLAQVSALICRSIVDGGAVTPLVVLLRDGSEDTSARAADILASIAAAGDEFRQVVIDAGAVSSLPKCLGSGTKEQRDVAVRALRNLTSGGEPARWAVVKILLENAQRGEDKPKEDAIAALAAVACDAPVCRRLVDPAHLSIFVQLMANGTDHQKKHAVQVLRCLAECNNGAFQDDIVRAKGMVALVGVIHEGPRDLQKDAALVLSVLARSSPANRVQLVELHVVPPLVEMTRQGDDELKTGATVALGSLMKSTAAQREVKLFGGVDTLRSLAKNGTPEQAKAARRALSKGSHCHVN